MEGYKYRFKQNLPLHNEPEDIQARMLYTFRSRRNHTYWVIIDKCVHNIYGIKFHLKAHRNSERKYNVLTNHGEARTVLYTCMNIMLNEVCAKDEMASVGFVGANKEGEDPSNTQRFRIYQTLVLTCVRANDVYEHFANEEKSAYILIPRKALEINPDLPDIYMEMLEHYEEQGGEL